MTTGTPATIANSVGGLSADQRAVIAQLQGTVLPPQTEHDIDIAVRTLYGEARGEPVDGQLAVVYVFCTRAALGAEFKRLHGIPHPLYGDGGLALVCLKPEQFSAWDAGNVNAPKIAALSGDSGIYRKLRLVVQSALTMSIQNPAPAATHYDVTGTGAFWERGHVPVAVIGHHSFFSLPNG